MSDPYIEKPDVREGEEDLVFCFLSESRVCNSSCVAFLTARPAGDEYVEQPWAQCAALVNAHRAGKHLVILASHAQVVVDTCKAAFKHFRIASIDAKRDANSL